MDILGSIGWRTEVDPSGAEAGLARLAAEVRAAMAALDREEATVEIKGDIRDLEDDILTAEKRLADFERRRARMAKGTTKAIDQQIASERDHLKVLKLKHKELKQTLRHHEDYRKELGRVDDALGDVMRASEATTLAHKKEGLEVERLRSRYSRLAAERAKLTRGRRRFEMFQTDTEKQRLREISAEMDLLGTRARYLGTSVTELDDDVDRNNGTLARWASSLANIRIHAGIASLTLRQFGIALVTLGPILTSVIGTLSALIGSLGEGIVGAALLGGTALSGFALATFGMIQALGGADKRMKQLGKSLEDIQKRFRARTGPARDAFFAMAERGIERLDKLMPTLAQGTNAVARALRSASGEFLRAFNVQEMDSFIDRMMGMTANILPDMGRALGNIADYMAEAFVHTAPFVEEAFENFAKWTGGLDASAAGVERLMNSLDSVTGFLRAAGGTMWAFFTSGADEGNALLDDMTASLDRTTEWIKSAAGQADLHEFFQDAINTAKELWDAISNIGEALLNIADAAQPFMQVFLDVTAAVAGFVNALESIPGVIPGLQLLAGGWLGGKVARGLGGMLTSIPLIGGGFAALGQKVKGAIPPIGLFNRTAATTVKTTAPAGKQLSLLGGSTARAGIGFGRLAAGAVSFLGPLGLMAGGAFFAADALGLFNDDQAEFNQQVAQSQQLLLSSKAAFNQQGQAALQTRGMILQYQDVLAKGGPVAQQAALQIRGSFRGLHTTIAEARANLNQMWEEGGGADAFVKIRDQFDNVIEDGVRGATATINDELAEIGLSSEDLERSLQRNGQLTEVWRDRLTELGVESELLDNLDAAMRPYRQELEMAWKATARLVTEQANLRRAKTGAELLGTKARQQIEGLARSFDRQQVLKWAVQIDDRQAQTRLLRLLNWARTALGKRAVMRIMANTKEPEEALRRLANMKREAEKPVAMKIRDFASDAIRGVQNLIKRTPDKHDTDVNARDRASSVLRGVQAAIRAVADRKTTTVDAIDRASSILRGVGALIASIPRNVTTVVSTVTRGAAALAGAGAVGGMLTSGGRPQDVPGFATGGTVIRQPAFVVGEEAPRHPEIVIATNPAYRDRNLGLLTMAASMLGVPAFAQGGVPGRYRVGAIPEDTAQREYDRARRRRERQETRLDRLRDRKGPMDPGLAEAQREEIQKARRAERRAKANLAAVKSVNRNIRREEAEIGRDTSRMDQFSAQGNVPGFNRARSSRLDNIQDLLRILTRAERRASGTFKVELQDRIAQLRSQHEEVERALPGSVSTLTGAETTRLANIERDIALAALTPGLEDDIFGRGKLTGFWEDVLARLQRTPGTPAEAITEAAQQLAAARDAQLNIGGGGIVSAGQVFSNARMDLYRQFGSNVMWTDTAMNQSGGQVGGATIINNWSTPPPDPHTWSQQQAYELQTI